MDLKIVTGMSGAGKTNFVQVLEDMGYYCVDNLPPNLFSKFVELILQVQSDYDKVALVADVRGGKFFQDVTRVLQELKNKGLKYEIIFLEASDDILVRRFKETRRRHPLAYKRGLLEGIQEDSTLTEESQSMVMNELRAHFRPEFLNRLDEIIMFKPLTKSNISGIIDLLVADVNLRLSEKELSIKLTESARNFVVEGGYDPMYGARPLKRYLQKNVETLAAKLILAGNVGRGDTIVIDVVDGKLEGRCVH